MRTLRWWIEPIRLCWSTVWKPCLSRKWVVWQDIEALMWWTIESWTGIDDGNTSPMASVVSRTSQVDQLFWKSQCDFDVFGDRRIAESFPHYSQDSEYCLRSIPLENILFSAPTWNVDRSCSHGSPKPLDRHGKDRRIHCRDTHAFGRPHRRSMSRWETRETYYVQDTVLQHSDDQCNGSVDIVMSDTNDDWFPNVIQKMFSLDSRRERIR